MPIGPTVRALFGPYERQISNAYRSIFINLNHWMNVIHGWVPTANRILEVGCGEGAMTELLRQRYPQAQITAIDISPRLGRLFGGDRQQVEFLQLPVEEIAQMNPHAYDLVILSDVLHHVPSTQRDSLLRGIKKSLAPGGSFVFKEWVRTPTPIHLLCEFSDRCLTGDNVSYLNVLEARSLLKQHFGNSALVKEYRVKPWRHNYALLIHPE